MTTDSSFSDDTLRDLRDFLALAEKNSDFGNDAKAFVAYGAAHASFEALDSHFA